MCQDKKKDERDSVSINRLPLELFQETNETRQHRI